jgi:hypothetical protein
VLVFTSCENEVLNFRFNDPLANAFGVQFAPDESAVADALTIHLSCPSFLEGGLSTINSQPQTALMKRRHMSERMFYPDTDDVSSRSKVVARDIAVFRFKALTINASTKPYDFFRFNGSTIERIPGTPKPWRRRHVATASLIRTADQARDKVGGGIADRTHEMISFDSTVQRFNE